MAGIRYTMQTASPDGSDHESEMEDLEPSLRNIVEQTSLKWIFVGGKGGVGKTTTSCALACQLAAVRKNVLLISTDPAHNLSDAFGQQIGKHETQLNGFENLFAMEIDPKARVDDMSDLIEHENVGMFAELVASIPGIDEAMSFGELMKQVQRMHYDVIVFDTAPTGHTLRLLGFPDLLEKGMERLISIQDTFSGLFAQFSPGTNSREKMFSKLNETRKVIEYVNRQFKDPNNTTFVCVCIPEFLSVYETERLVQELAKFEIDTHCLVVNQVLFPEKDSNCRKCNARIKMQSKYLAQIADLYEEFNIVTIPLLDEEVRGVPALKAFAENLMKQYDPNSD
eukprot:109567_1